MPVRLAKILFSLLITFLFLHSNAYAQVVINEFLVNPNPEWVEFYNVSDNAEYIKNYWLDDDTDFDDDTNSSPIKSLSSLNTDSITFPFIEFNSFLNNQGDYVVLFNSQGDFIDQFQYTFSPENGVAVGRSPDQTGNIVVLASATKGYTNSGPQPTPTPTPTPTPKPTSTPTPKPTPTPTPKPTPLPTKKPTPTLKPTKTPEVLGIEQELEDEMNSEDNQIDQSKEQDESSKDNQEKKNDEEKKEKSPYTLPFIIILIGVVLLGVASMPYLGKAKEIIRNIRKQKDQKKEL